MDYSRIGYVATIKWKTQVCGTCGHDHVFLTTDSFKETKYQLKIDVF